MKIILDCIIKSLYGIFNILIVLFAVWIIFGIIGVQLFKGKFGYCGFPENLNINLKTCLESKKYWNIHQNNFENIFDALLTLYVVTTYDHLATMITVAVNSNYSDFVKIKLNNNKKKNLLIYFLLIINS